MYTRGVSADAESGGPPAGGAAGDAPLCAFAELDEAALMMRGRALGACLQPGDVVLLDGSMGAGKTTLTRAIACGLGVDHPERVHSPTFTLCMVHPGRALHLVHVDLFRQGGDDDEGLGGSAGLDALGLEELLADGGLLGEGGPGPEKASSGPQEPVLVVEWGSRWRAPPADHLTITLSRVSPERRSLVAAATGPRAAALLSAWAAACEARPSSSA